MTLSKESKVQLTIGTLVAVVISGSVYLVGALGWLDSRYARQAQVSALEEKVSEKASLAQVASRDELGNLHKRIDLTDQAAEFRQTALDRIERKLDALLDEARRPKMRPPGPTAPPPPAPPEEPHEDPLETLRDGLERARERAEQLRRIERKVDDLDEKTREADR